MRCTVLFRLSSIFSYVVPSLCVVPCLCLGWYTARLLLVPESKLHSGWCAVLPLLLSRRIRVEFRVHQELYQGYCVSTRSSSCSVLSA